jgi:hypothetical protein
MEPADALFKSRIELDQEVPRVLASRLLAHVSAESDLEVMGAQEALGGWDMVETPGRPGRLQGPAWAPGSVVVDGSGTECVWEPRKDGTWALVP